jgi:hypothetical protein
MLVMRTHTCIVVELAHNYITIFSESFSILRCSVDRKDLYSGVIEAICGVVCITTFEHISTDTVYTQIYEHMKMSNLLHVVLFNRQNKM